MAYICKRSANNAYEEEEITEVSGEMMDESEPKRIHYDDNSGGPLDEDVYQQGRDDELHAMQDYGVFLDSPTTEAVGGKHIRGFPIANMKEGKVTRFVATEIKTEFKEDSRLSLSRAVFRQEREVVVDEASENFVVAQTSPTLLFLQGRSWHLLLCCLDSDLAASSTGHVAGLQVDRQSLQIKLVRLLNSWGGLDCLLIVPGVAADSASLALFLLMEDAALMVDSALGRVALLVSLLLIVLSCLSKPSAWMLLCVLMLLVRSLVSGSVSSLAFSSAQSSSLYPSSSSLASSKSSSMAIFSTVAMESFFCFCLLLIAASPMFLVSVLP